MQPAAFAAIGECMIELSGGRDDLWRMGFAGDTFNTAWYARRLLPASAAVAYVTAIGSDPFSDRMAGFFADSGIAADRVRRVADRRPGLYAITLDGAERRFTYWRGEAAARRLADDAGWLERALSGCGMLHLSGITLAILPEEARARLVAALAAARRSGARIAFDTNWRPALWPDEAAARAAMQAVYPIADIVLPTFDDERALFGDASPEATAGRIAAAGPREIAVKNGVEPCLVVAGEASRFVPAESAVEPVDTTGAGDSFGGAYLAARLIGRDPFAAARIGHRVAGRVVRVHGALAPIAPADVL